VSAARQALSAGPLAPGERSTLDELTDPNRRPQAPYQALDPAVLQYKPPEPVDMPADLLLTSLRRARKAAAPGPSGLTAEMLQLVLDDEEATQKFVRVGQRLASADLPTGIHQAMGLGRLIALQKPNGRVRGIVIGDLLRRLVSRCLAQRYAKQIDQACLPHQYALSTRAGTEAVVHALTTDAEQHPTGTILSVDGIGGECKRLQTRFLPSDDLKQLRLQRREAENRGIKIELSFQIGKLQRRELGNGNHQIFRCIYVSPTNGSYYKGYNMALAVKLPISLRQTNLQTCLPTFSAGIRAIHFHHLNLRKRIGTYKN